MSNLSNREKQSCARKDYITPIVGTLRVELGVAAWKCFGTSSFSGNKPSFSQFRKEQQPCLCSLFDVKRHICSTTCTM